MLQKYTNYLHGFVIKIQNKMWKKVIFCWLVFMGISAITHYVRGYFKPIKPYKKIVVISNSNFKGTIEARNTGKQGYTLSMTDKETGKIDTVFLRYDIYALQAGDINNDGKIDICVGLINPKKADDCEEKNLFFLEIAGGHIRPLLPQVTLNKDLESFKVFHQEERSIIRTIEREKDSKTAKISYAVGEYVWHNATLKLLAYKGKKLTLAKAKFLLYQI
jgi:hypothetical protein